MPHSAPIAPLLILASVLVASAMSVPSVRSVPAPKPAATGKLTVGAICCPLWRTADGRQPWKALEAYPERTPLLGHYDEGDPEVTDWEIKWALEHGVGLFVACWYRARDTLGKPARPVLGHWLHEGLFRSRFGARIRFAILWENANSIACGVQSEQDLLENLLPFWIEHYFRRPNYLREGDKPVLFLYRPERLTEELGGAEKTRQAIGKMREACKRAGLKGLIIGGEYHGESRVAGPEAYAAMGALGLDFSYSYHWPTFTSRMPPPDGRTETAIMDAQEECWREGAAGPIPHVVTVSTGWDSRPWGGAYSKAQWRLSPDNLQALAERARRFAVASQSVGLARRLVLLDNWNEFGEGHYLIPTRADGFAHLDAIRRAFAPRAGHHTDLAPDDIGLGPYDSLHRGDSNTEGNP